MENRILNDKNISVGRLVVTLLMLMILYHLLHQEVGNLLDIIIQMIGIYHQMLLHQITKCMNNIC